MAYFAVKNKAVTNVLMCKKLCQETFLARKTKMALLFNESADSRVEIID